MQHFREVCELHGILTQPRHLVYAISEGGAVAVLLMLQLQPRPDQRLRRKKREMLHFQTFTPQFRSVV